MSRRQPRVKCILPVRIWGTDCEGKTFVEHGCTANISRWGASLVGVHARLSVGDTIGLQYRNQQARFRVAWIVPARTAPGWNPPQEVQGLLGLPRAYSPGSASASSHIGLECLQPGKNLWPVPLPGEQPDTYVQPGAHPQGHDENFGGHPSRFPVSGTAYVSKVGAAHGHPAEVADISLDGCYLKTSHPKSVGERVKLLIRIGHSDVEALGVVRAHYPGAAMGVEFTFMNSADQSTLERLISDLRGSDTMTTNTRIATTPRGTRRWRRFDLTLPVRITIEKCRQVSVMNSRASQINAGGLALLADTELAIGDEAEFAFLDYCVTLRGVVRDDTGNGYGIEFLATSDAEAEQLDIFRHVLSSKVGGLEA